jgi:hypothetical protein
MFVSSSFNTYVNLPKKKRDMLKPRRARQKSRVQWLNLGDKNHHCRNKILSIQGDDDTCIIEAKEVNDTIVNYFQNLLGGPRSKYIDLSFLGEVLPWWSS